MTILRKVLPVSLLLAQGAWALIPVTPGEQTIRAIRSTRETISKIRESSTLPPRIYIDYLIPLPPATTDADIDPWPGGLAQQYSYAEDILRDILCGVVEDSTRDKCSTQVLSADDCCGLFIQESPISPDLDVAAVLFPGVDQFAKLKEIENMVGDKRTLIIFNRQYKRPEDFGMFGGKQEAKGFMEKYQWGFAFQEIACRGEDVKLTFEQSVGWQSCLVDENGKEIEIKDSSWDVKLRPEYDVLTSKINEILPEPLWMRMMQKANAEGLKFQRKDE